TKTSLKSPHRLQQRSALARAGRNWPRGFEDCHKKRKTPCWYPLYRSPVNAGKVIFCGIFRGTTRHVHHLQLALLNGALLAISSPLPMRVRKRGTGC
ncbi:MAG: hypothetical protein WA354_20730, partial [Terracidiphilus sp.]